jgi:adenine-specific DNA-methyltransferase
MDAVEKFQGLLKKLFQFEASDLDFGIYRILNNKRERIEKFIQAELKNKVETAFAKHKDERLADINERFEKAKEKVIQTLGEDAFTPTGEIKEEFKNTPLGRDFLSVKAQRDEAQAIDEIKLQVFNDLYNFFSRYYEEGDFIPHYRYSIKGHKYAIPYNGEEVKLYWANSEQYYTKTGLLFRDYTFKADDYKVIFRIVLAREELASNKATKERFFILDDENPLTIEDKVLIIRFQYRELTEEEVKHYEVEGGSNTAKQEKINQKSYDEVLKKARDATLKAILGKEYKPVLSKSEGNEKPLLLYQISRFTAKNTKDYFIHKDIKRFLSEQLDYFIKAEVLDIETLEKARFLDKHLTRARVVREIGEDIIDFLAQLEDFQKRLWEKKKFVLKTEYVITTDRVPEEFYDEILRNEAQIQEWKELGLEIATPPSGARNDKKEGSLRGTKATKQSLKNLHLPIDTRYFSQEFKERLLERLTTSPVIARSGSDEAIPLDDLLDGILIKSENWQALNLLLEKYKEKVQTIYIDPPFNKEQDADYLYNVKYKDSTWASILENRLRLARDLLSDRGSIFVRCDYNGNWIVRPLMNEIFGEENFRNEMILKRTAGLPKRELLNMEVETEYLIYYAKNAEKLLFNQLWEDREPKWMPVMIKYNRGGPTGKPIILEGKTYNPPEGYSWAIGNEIAQAIYKEGRLKIMDGKPYVLIDKKTVGSNWTDIPGYVSPPKWGFSTENHEKLLKRAIETASTEGDLVMDFFLGSGTTTAVAHKLGRKWIGVEMGEHFYTVVLPRMKKVLAYDKSGISKEKDVKEKYNEKTAGGFFKYQILEQYEDTLDNIELTQNKQAELRFGDDYLLKYFLDFETRESPYLLKIENLKNPFAYKLKVNLEEVGEPQEVVVDIPETFNYLLGFKVKKIKAREIASPAARNDRRRYLFILGEKQGKDIAIVWREYEDNWSDEDFKKDKEFIKQELRDWKPQVVYVNGQSVLTPKEWEVRYIEPEFKKLMR